MFLLLQWPLCSWAAKIITSQAGKVGQHIVSTREVVANALIENALGRRTEAAKLNLNQPKSREFVRETTAVLLEWAIFFEAEGFATSNVTRAERDKALSQVNAALGKYAQWRALKMKRNEVQNMVERKLRAKKFIQFKVESSSVPISDNEAKDYFEANPLKFENLPFENFKDTIKAYLSRQQVDRRLKDWFELLQVKYKVQNYLTE